MITSSVSPDMFFTVVGSMPSEIRLTTRYSADIVAPVVMLNTREKAAWRRRCIRHVNLNLSDYRVGRRGTASSFGRATTLFFRRAIRLLWQWQSITLRNGAVSQMPNLVTCASTVFLVYELQCSDIIYT